ncbi:MAG: lytic transglycosylase domain-containing protein [Candidatus Caenarcaniphilales bacterium]|nr:lytic transglycosylase domain-containing protein [Candidatus Caenarcaniphilales bacterium]
MNSEKNTSLDPLVTPIKSLNSKHKNLLNASINISLALTLALANISFVLSNQQSNADVEMFLGEERIFVNSDGQSSNRSGSVGPQIITPQGFNDVVQPKAYAPSNQVSKTFREMRAKKNRNSSPFSIDTTILSDSELSPLLSEALRRPQVMVSMNQLTKGNKRIDMAKQRLQYYQGIFEKIFAEEGVPNELISIGFVESTYNPSAISPAGARGIWQFIPSTGKMFGLNSSEDFSDPVKSTRAAAKYLKRLHKRFGNWLLAVAAYNAGDTRVQQAINMSNGNKDFWEVSKFLPNETRNYVPRVLAATTLIGNAKAEVASVTD